MGIEFRLLGEVEARVDGRTLGAGHARQRCVLAALLVDVNRMVPVGHLLDRVWADRLPQRARVTLSGYVSRLRSTFAGIAGVEITRKSGGYLFAADPMTVDLHRFRRLTAEARATADPDAAADLLDEALGLWRGQAFAGLDTPWLSAVREALHRERLAAELDRHDLALARGRHSAILGELFACAAAHPMDERLAGQLMLALYRCGRQAEALQHYEQLRRTLADELGADPSPPLRSLHQQILAADPGLAPAPRDAGLPVPQQLPVPPRAFAGRVTELAELDALLDPGQVTLVVLSGTAGVGKTALALHWAHLVRERFSGGQLYLNLRGYASTHPMPPLAALGKLLQAFGVPGEQVPTDLEQAAALLRTVCAGKQLLLLLDNARDAGQIRPLLPATPGSLVLITSRDTLGGLIALEAATHLRLKTLTSADAELVLTGILGGDRVGKEPDAAADLARLCANLPLALRIAAANLALRPGRAIADHVAALVTGNRLSHLCLDGDEDTAVRTAFDLSYQSLSPDARLLFRRLGGLPCPDVTAEAAAVLIDLDPQRTVNLLNHLSHAHLLERDSADRYAFHDLLRLYAAERARSEDPVAQTSAAVERVCAWYLRAAEAAAELLYPSMLRLPRPSTSDRPIRFASRFPSHATALAWLEGERHNLVAMIQELAAVAPPSLCHLADVLRGYFQLRRYANDWLTVAEAALVAARIAGDLRAQAAAHTSLGTAHRSLGRHRQALRHYARALRLSRDSGWRQCEALTLGNLGIACQYLGLLRPAVRQLHRALELDRATGRRAGEANNLINLANVRFQMGMLGEAESYFAQGLERTIAAGSHLGEALALTGLGEVYRAMGRLGEADLRLREALRRCRQIGDRDGQAVVWHCLSAVDSDRGDVTQARAHALESLELTRETGDRRTEAAALVALATAHLHLGQAREAGECGEQALALARQTLTRRMEIEALLVLAQSRRALGDLDGALKHGDEALLFARKGGYRLHEQRACALTRNVAPPPDPGVPPAAPEPHRR